MGDDFDSDYNYQAPSKKNTNRRPRFQRASRDGKKYDPGNPNSRRQLLHAARSAIGTPYVVGGARPGGFDCSGLVCWAYGNVGVKLPRTAREQSVVGTRIRREEDMQPGDIVAFRHPTRGYHTGIYVGDGKFIHSPRRKSHVKINSLDDPYFNSTFLGARRINLGGRENLLAQAENRLKSEYRYSPVRFASDNRESRSSRMRADSSRKKRQSMASYRDKKRDSEHSRRKINNHRSSRERMVASRSDRPKRSSADVRSSRSKKHENVKNDRDKRKSHRSASSERTSNREKSKRSSQKNRQSNKREAAANNRQDKRSRSDKKKRSSKS
ncbi:MAG: C40 family peptidase [Desulfovibrio sp.]|nr:C40 family peptidase [Desulfovibrio sp.]